MHTITRGGALSPPILASALKGAPPSFKLNLIRSTTSPSDCPLKSLVFELSVANLAIDGVKRHRKLNSNRSGRTQPEMLEMTRIHVTGASGAGTTTLGLALATDLRLPHFEADDYLWEPTVPPYERTRSKEDRLRLLETDLAPTLGWVLSGSLTGWGDPLLVRFELVIFVMTPTDVRLARLRHRETERFGAEALRPGGRMYKRHIDFIAWAAGYDDGDESIRSRHSHEAWLARLPCQVLRVDGTRSLEALVDEVRALLNRARE